MTPVMKNCAALLLSFAGLAGAASPPAAWKPAMDRLDSITHLPLPGWRFHTDIAHPEDPRLDDSAWPLVNPRDHWTGACVLRRVVEIPEKIDGYDIRGAQIRLDLQIGSSDQEMVTVFSNGSVVARTDEDTQQPIVLTESAQPGNKFLIAVRVDANDVETRLGEAELQVEPAAGRPDPGLLKTEILAAFPLATAYPDGQEERRRQLDAAVRSIDLAALDRGDQAAFDHSLKAAHDELESLKPWLKQFSIRAVGNAHIDMAWLWPWTETVEVVRNTFRSALDLMREYPK